MPPTQTRLTSSMPCCSSVDSLGGIRARLALIDPCKFLHIHRHPGSSYAAEEVQNHGCMFVYRTEGYSFDNHLQLKFRLLHRVSANDSQCQVYSNVEVKNDLEFCCLHYSGDTNF